jgi:predicted DNA-binding protein (MmcQ/YjbR family)
VAPLRRPRARKSPALRAPVLARLRKLCLALPGAVEKLSHGEPTWFTRAKGRCFAMLDDHHHDSPHLSVYVATPPEVQRGLVAFDPDRYWVPPYVGRRGWVAIVLDADPDWTSTAALLRQAYRFVSEPEDVLSAKGRLKRRPPAA